jgi:hypothetical protein
VKKILVFLLCIMGNCFSKEEKIKLYACYTPSHSELAKDWFFPALKDDFDVVVESFPHECPEAAFMSAGFVKTY